MPARHGHLVPLSRPVPQDPPDYDHERGRTAPGPRFELYSLLDNLFIAAGVVVSIWLALLYLVEGFSLTPIRLLYLLGFWVLLTYITLPRLHQLMTWIYLPDYFIGRTRTTEGVLSDPVNLAFDGSERDLHVAMRRAGWVLAEERTLASAWSMVRSTLLRRSYPGGPGLEPVPDGASPRLHLPAGGGGHHRQAPSCALLAGAAGLRAAGRVSRGLAGGGNLRPRRRASPSSPCRSPIASTRTSTSSATT